jgi:hypothetical protein
MVTLFLLVLCLTSAFAELPPSVGYYAGRSADIIIQSESATVQDSVIFFKGDQLRTTELKQVEDAQFADMFAHVMGTQPFHVDADRNGFPSTSLFNKPKAAAVVVVESVGSEILSKYPTLALLQNAHISALTTQSTPSNTHTLLANLATGTTPSKHGIVGASWRRPVSGEYVSAYSPSGLSFSANIADILLQETNGLSLVVSASASQSFASALGAHPELVAENLGWRAHAYALSESGAFESRYADPSVDQVLQVAESGISTDDVTVRVGNTDVTFRPSVNYADFELFAEIAFVNNLISKLQSDAVLSVQVKDNVPDLYSFVFSSLKGIQTRYGADSATFAAALNLVDKTADTFLTALNALYDNRVAVTIAALNAHDTSSEAVKTAVYNKVARILYTQEDFATFFPVVYVKTLEFNGYTRDITCANLQKAVSDARVLCVSPFLPVRGLRSVDAANGSSSSSEETAAADVAYIWAFWLNFFVTLIIFSFIGWGVYCLAYVGADASGDSLLFRASGRGGQHHHQN